MPREFGREIAKRDFNFDASQLAAPSEPPSGRRWSEHSLKAMLWEALADRAMLFSVSDLEELAEFALSKGFYVTNVEGFDIGEDHYYLATDLSLYSGDPEHMMKHDTLIESVQEAAGIAVAAIVKSVRSSGRPVRFNVWVEKAECQSAATEFPTPKP